MSSRWYAITGVLLAVTCVSVAVMVSLRTVRSEPRTIPLVKPLACSFCAHQYTGELGDRPGKCPNCGERGIWPASRCAKCANVVAMDMDKFNAQKRDPYCPKCGSRKLVDIIAAGVERSVKR